MMNKSELVSKKKLLHEMAGKLRRGDSIIGLAGNGWRFTREIIREIDASFSAYREALSREEYLTIVDNYINQNLETMKYPGELDLSWAIPLFIPSAPLDCCVAYTAKGMPEPWNLKKRGRPRGSPFINAVREILSENSRRKMALYNICLELDRRKIPLPDHYRVIGVNSWKNAYKDRGVRALIAPRVSKLLDEQKCSKTLYAVD